MAENRELDLGAIGSSGLKQFSGVIDEEFHPKLRGQYGPKVYREMVDNSSTIGAIRYLIKSLTRGVSWWVEPASDEQAAKDAAEFVETCLVDLSLTFEDLISEVLSFLDYGWAYFEIVYKLRKGEGNEGQASSSFDDGKIGWRKISLRSQDTLDHWEFDQEDGGLRGMWQLDPNRNQAVYIPIEKAILFRTETTKGNPEGRSIFRNAVVDYFFLKRISEIEAIGIERDLSGLPVMEVPIRILETSATPAEVSLRNTLAKMLAEIKRDERDFAIVPSELDNDGRPTGYKFKLLSTGGRRQIDTTEIKNYYKINILQSVASQFIQLGMSEVGSFALASSQTNLFAVALGAYLDSIVATFNRFAIDRLMALNNIERDAWPELVHGDIETPPLAEIGAYVSALAGAGQLPESDAIQRKLLEIANLPMPEANQKSETTKGLILKRRPDLQVLAGGR